MPKVSIIIPVYNTEAYLQDCLSSVQHQTLSDFEAIIVNDCTPDKSMEIAREYEKADRRFRIIEHKNNKRLGGARNTGVQAAGGKYINFLDSDDFLPLDAIEKMHEIAEENNADMVIGNMAWKNNHILKPVVYIDDRIHKWEKCHKKNIRNLPLSYYASGQMCHRLIRRTILLEHSIFFPEHTLWEDMPFAPRIWFHSKFIAYTPSFVYFRTKRNDPNNPSITQQFHEKAFLDRDKIVEEVYRFPDSVEINNAEARELAIITLNRILNTTQEMITSADEDIKFQIQNIWYPKHLIQIEQYKSILKKFNQ